MYMARCIYIYISTAREETVPRFWVHASCPRVSTVGAHRQLALCGGAVVKVRNNSVRCKSYRAQSFAILEDIIIITASTKKYLYVF